MIFNGYVPILETLVKMMDAKVDMIMAYVSK